MHHCDSSNSPALPLVSPPNNHHSNGSVWTSNRTRTPPLVEVAAGTAASSTAACQPATAMPLDSTSALQLASKTVAQEIQGVKGLVGEFGE